MKLIETLTKQQKIDMFSGDVVGIFPSMILPIDSFYSILPDLCLGYYTARSGLKPISVMYELLQEYEENGIKAEHNIGKFIRGKYIDKWERIYSVLLDSQYDALNNYDYAEHKSGDNTNIDTFNARTDKNGNNSDSSTLSEEHEKKATNTDIKTYDVGVVDEGKKGTHEIKTLDTYNNDDVYGFNSVDSVPDKTSVENSSETVVGEADKNTTYNKNSKTGTETDSTDIIESESKTGTNTNNYIRNESEVEEGTNTRKYNIEEDVTKSGRNVSGAEMVQRELNLRNTQIFFDIIYRDIDSIATLEIYI